MRAYHIKNDEMSDDFGAAAWFDEGIEGKESAYEAIEPCN